MNLKQLLPSWQNFYKHILHFAIIVLAPVGIDLTRQPLTGCIDENALANYFFVDFCFFTAKGTADKKSICSSQQAPRRNLERRFQF